MSQVDDIIGQLENGTQERARQLVINLHERFQAVNPVDTGWSRSNWLASIGRPREGTIGSKEDVDNTQAILSLTSISSWTFSQGSAYLVNNVPYIRDLNNGSSPQAPAGWIEMGIQAELAIANRGTIE